MKQIKTILWLILLICFAGCASPYVGKSRQEIVGLIAEQYNKAPGKIHIYVPRGSNYHFNNPSEILNVNRGWGPDMKKYDQWGIFPYRKFWYDGYFCTLVTFRDGIVVKEEEAYCGGYGFKPLFILLAFPLIFM